MEVLLNLHDKKSLSIDTLLTLLGVSQTTFCSCFFFLLESLLRIQDAGFEFWCFNIEMFCVHHFQTSRPEASHSDVAVGFMEAVLNGLCKDAILFK